MREVSLDDVRAVGLALPRAYEAVVRDRIKLRVGPIVFVAFSGDERAMGFGFPREERADLVAARPDTFFLPRPSDLRFAWVCAHLERLDPTEMRELVTDAWRMCVPRMLHDLPDLPAPAMAAWAALDRGDGRTFRSSLAPDVTWVRRDAIVTGRAAVMTALAARTRVRPPREVEVAAGLITRWVE